MSADVWSQVIINQVFYDSPLNEEITHPPYSNGEFIELYNTQDSAVSLSGWHLHGGGKTERYDFPSNITLSAHGYLSVAYRHLQTSSFVLDSLIELPDSYLVLYQRKVILSNSGEGLALYNADNMRVDTMRYTARPAKNADSIPLADCLSMQRIGISYNQNQHGVYQSQDWVAGFVNFAQTAPTQQSWLPDADYYGGSLMVSNDKAYIVRVSSRSSTSGITSTEGDVLVSGGGMADVTITWYDPLGRNIQSTQRRKTSSGKNIVTSTLYTASNSTRQWLPLPTESNDFFEESVFASSATSYYDDNAPYRETVYEKLYKGRPTTTTQAGVEYQSHPATESYGVNVSDEVVRWSVGQQQVLKEGCYSEGTLQKLTHADEDGHAATIFTDAAGKKIMLRMGDDVETYYVYDDLGRLRYVLPPAAVKALSSCSSFTDSAEPVRHYAYIYRYDNRGNCIYKKLPGIEPIYMVYDRLGQLALTQDGNQRQRGDYWTAIRYNQYGDMVIRCEILSASSSHADMLSYWSDKTALASFSLEPSNRAIAGTGYIDANESLQVSQMLEVNYYDDYASLSCLPDSISNRLTYQQLSGYDTRSNNAIGMLTSKRIYTLGDTTYTYTVYYYDKYGQLIQQRASEWDGSYEYSYMAYNFDGSVANTLKQRSQITETYTYEYDITGMPTRTLYSINNSEPTVLSADSYDDLSRLTNRQRHNAADSESYEYDLRGNLTQTQSGDFTELLVYVSGNIGYCGTISEMTVVQDTIQQNWHYQYDNLKRLTSSSLTNGNSAQRLSEQLTYDDMGNILTLERYVGGVLTDDLEYSYRGNQLVGLTNYAEPSDTYDITQYPDRSDADTTMRYDANGNLIADFDRQISAIQYNLLNLPTQVQFSNGNAIVNTYNAGGVKLSTTYYTLPENVVVPIGTILPIEYTSSDVSVYQKRYFGNVEYESFANDTTVQVRIHNAEGYVAATLSNDHLITTTYNYYRRDHLGNIVSVWDATNDTTVQRTFYYATGMPMPESRGRSKQPNLYNGKEYEQVHGYNVYDFGARGYYAAVARFTSIDPLAENTPWQSPYNYASNNFIAEIDWMGLGDVYTTNNQDAIASLLGYLSNGGSLNDYDFDESEGWIDVTDEVRGYLGLKEVYFNINSWIDTDNSYGTGPFIGKELMIKGFYVNPTTDILKIIDLIDGKSDENALDSNHWLLNPLFGDNVSAISLLLERYKSASRIGQLMTSLSYSINFIQYLSLLQTAQKQGISVGWWYNFTKTTIGLIPIKEIQMIILVVDTYDYIWSVYNKQYKQLDNHLNSIDFWAYYYGY
ncbi:MAG: lamin tail domain-containing protein [Paludibacteraceae bacterium]|nr:lamin tail domain-containing protein [Paludibacteraceae bacterium]